MLVPSATNIMAVIESFMPNVAPKWEATSPMTAVTRPIPMIDTTKHKYPLAISETKKGRSYSLLITSSNVLLNNALENFNLSALYYGLFHLHMYEGLKKSNR